MLLLDGALLLAPVVGTLAVGALVLLVRRVLKAERVEQATGTSVDDFGLLRPAAVTRDLVDAELVRRHLATAGIRSTLARDADGRVQVLVFADELDRARKLAG